MTSGVQIGEIEQVIVQNLFKIWENYITLMVFNIFGDDALKFIINSRIMK